MTKLHAVEKPEIAASAVGFGDIFALQQEWRTTFNGYLATRGSGGVCRNVCPSCHWLEEENEC
jgi:hypothetical protein